MEKISMFELGNMARPVKVFIKKISDAVGIIYEPTRIIRGCPFFRWNSEGHFII